MHVRSGGQKHRMLRRVNDCVGEWSVTEFVTESARKKKTEAG